MSGELRDISVARLVGGPNVREKVDEGLRRSIEEHGVLQAITVCRRGGRFQVLYGHRRVAAARAAGLERIPAIVVDEPPDLAIRQVIENVDRKPMSPLEVARALQAHLDANPGMTMAALARTLGRSQPYVSHKLELLRLADDVVARIEAGELTETEAINARRRAVRYATGRPRDIPLPEDGTRTASVTIPIGRSARGPRAEEPTALIGVDLEAHTADLVVSDGRGSSLFVTLSIAEAKLLGRRLQQAAEALLAATPTGVAS